MNYFKNTKNEIFAYDDEQVAQGHAKGLTSLTQAEIDAVLNPPKTKAQIIAEWKQDRQQKVDNIEVTYNNVVYQGDETSQTRITKAITALPDDTTTVDWIAKDNSVQSLTRIDLKAILLDAGTQQSKIWNEGRPE